MQLAVLGNLSSEQGERVRYTKPLEAGKIVERALRCYKHDTVKENWNHLHILSIIKDKDVRPAFKKIETECK